MDLGITMRTLPKSPHSAPGHPSGGSQPHLRRELARGVRLAKRRTRRAQLRFRGAARADGGAEATALNDTLLAGAVVASCLGVPAAHAQEADFSRKTITIFIGNTAGGTYDLMGRLVARHLGRFLPGNPTAVPENMPGAGTLRAANHIFNVAPKDGTALGIVSETIAVEQALHNPAVQFDARKLAWIGRVAASNAVYIIWHDSKVHSIEDARRFEATTAGTGTGNLGETIPTLLNAVIGTKFKIIKGYPAANEALLAMERGEVEGAVVNWTTVKTAKAQWLQEGKVNVILQVLTERGPDLPMCPRSGSSATISRPSSCWGSTPAPGRSDVRSSARPGCAPRPQGAA